MPFCLQPTVTVCEDHASWGSQEDVMLVFMNQDAYDKFRLSKEDYELQKELEKEQKKESEKDADSKDKKKKEDGDKKESDKVKEVVVELDGIQDRIVRLTPNSSDLGSAILSKDGEKLYYLAAFEGGYDLWKIDLRKRDVKLLHKNVGRGSMEMDKEGKNIFILEAACRKWMPLRKH